jgi:hypothetical protein
MPRGRTQVGQLYICGPKGREYWSGRFRVYVKTKAGEHIVRRTHRIGFLADNTRTQALNKMAQLIHSSGPKIAVACAPAGELTNLGSHAKGNIAEMLVSIDLVKRGYEVFRHECEFASCDIVALKDDSFTRIEVKYVGIHNRYHDPLGKFDILAKVYPDSTIQYAGPDGKDFVFNWAVTDHKEVLSA